MLRIAIERGAPYRKGNREVDAPKMRTIEPLFGKFIMPHGTVTCWFYSSRVFCVDFDKQRITDYGMRSYSMSTGQNIAGWVRAFRVKFGHFVGNNLFYEYGAWSFNSRNLERGSQMFLRFAQRVPWVHIDANGIGWFHWPKWDEALHKTYFASSSFLHESQNWRYFDFDWAEDGRWERKFINDDAKRRWEAREQRRGRQKNGDLPRRVPAAP